MMAGLRALGTWGEEDWVYPEGRVARDAHAVKQFWWRGEAVLTRTGETMTLQYQAFTRLLVGQMENLELVAQHERVALELLARPVALALEGVGFVALVNPWALAYAAVRALLQGWIDADGYPETWDPELQRALSVAQRQTQAAMAWQQRAGATLETDPVLRQFGMRLPIVPMTRPVLVAP